MLINKYFYIKKIYKKNKIYSKYIKYKNGSRLLCM